MLFQSGDPSPRMVADTPVVVRLLDSLKLRLLDAVEKGEFSGALYGLELPGGAGKLVLAATGSLGGEVELCNEMIPCGVEPLGVWGGGGVAGLVGLAGHLPALTQGDARPLVLGVAGGGVEGGVVGEGGQVQDLEVGGLTSQELGTLTTLVRIKGNLELNCGLSEAELSNAFRHLIEKVSYSYLYSYLHSYCLLLQPLLLTLVLPR